MPKPERKHEWQEFAGDVGDELHLLRNRVPPEKARAGVWIEWHERQADCWKRLAARDSCWLDHDKWLGDEHRRKAEELRANPFGVGGRRGYWTQ